MTSTERPLSHRQRLIWAGQRLDPDVPLYNMAHAATIGAAIDPEAFQRALTALVAESDALRTVIVEEEGEPAQRTLDTLDPGPIPVIDLADDPDPDHAADRWIAERARRRLDLSARLWDTALLRLEPDRWIWFLNQHHLITDAWSVSLLLGRQGELYAAALDPTAEPGGRPLAPFAEFLDAEAAAVGSKGHRRAVAHWERWSAEHGARATDPMAFYGHRPTTVGPETVRVTAAIDGERGRRVAAFLARPEISALSPELTALRFFQTVLVTYLHRTTGAEALTIGLPFHNRASRDAKRTAGLCMNIVPVAATIDGDETLVDLSARLGAQTFEAMQHGRFGPGGALPAGPGSRFEVVLNYLHVPDETFGGLPIEDRWVHPGAGDRDHGLRLQIRRLVDDRFRLYFDVKTDLFDTEARRALVDQFLGVIDGWLSDPEATVGALPMVTSTDADRLITGFNRSTGPSLPSSTVVDEFESIAADHPDAVAIAGAETLTYGELNGRANRLAHDLGSQGVGPGDTIGIALDRGADALAAILGVLKSGAAYVPMESSVPPLRLAQIVADAAVGIVCTDDQGSAVVAAAGAKPLIAGDVVRGDGPTDDPTIERSLDDRAYVIFTSGSTGRPKGVPVDHRGLANYVAWAGATYTGDRPRTFALFTSLAFDLTVTSIFVPLTSGGSIVTYPETDDATPPIVEVWRDDRVDVAKATPSHLAIVRELGLVAGRLEVLIVGGEDFTTDLAADLQAAHDDLAIFNEYGPTETVVGCMVHRFDPDRDRWPSVPIGRPAANAEILLLDDRGAPVPPGVVGTIHIGGPGVSSGYLGRPELTADRFVERPAPVVPTAATIDGGRLFRTGDLGRWQLGVEPPHLEFLGRADEQVKVRGHRIELGEIEAVLSAAVDLDRAAVVATTRTVGPRPADPGRVIHCGRCGLPSTYPGADIEAGVCSLCRGYDTYRDHVDAYFSDRVELRAIADRIIADRVEAGRAHDCVVLLSGGKDSTYMLYQVVALGLRPLVFTLDNGYLSDAALANCRRVCDHLGVDLEIGATPHMREIFRDSLDRFSNVCNGCFKTIYTLSMDLARRHGIGYVVTGLARGQLFETRLSDMYDHSIFDVEQIDRFVLEARKAYHQIDDAVTRLLDVDGFTDGSIFDDVQFVDFYRYVDVGLDEVLGFLAANTPWTRPPDTGRSTNCLINDVGIHVHQRERGFHNYALPYSWDVRLGHKNREAALDELDDDIDTDYVQEVLVEIGYRPKPPPSAARETTQLVAHYQAPVPVDEPTVRAELARSLPDYMIPTRFVRHDQLPLTANGKIDRAALTAAESGVDARRGRSTELTGDAARAGEALRAVWEEIFGRTVELDDDFFDLGGDSIIAIQIVARAATRGLTITPRHLFEAGTVAAAATVATWEEAAAPAAVEARPDGDGDHADLPLTPTQTGMLFHSLAEPMSGVYEGQIVHDLRGEVDHEILARCWDELVERHPMLRAAFRWVGTDQPVSDAVDRRTPMAYRDWSSHPSAEAALDELLAEDRAEPFDLTAGPPVRLALVRMPDRTVLVWSFHHIALDGWSIALAMNELLDAHQAARDGRRWSPPARGSFADYVAWLGAQDRAAAEAFWRTELAGFTAPTPLPTSRPPEVAAAIGSDRRRYGAGFRRLGRERTAAVLDAARRERVTLSTVLQAAWALVLARHDGADDVVFGLTTSGRPATLPGADSMIGMLVTTLPARVGVIEELAPGEWLRRLQSAQLGARDHEYASLVDIGEWSELGGGQPLFTSILVVENFPDYVPPTPDHVAIDDRSYRVQSNYPLSVIALPGDDLTLKAVHDPDVIDGDDVDALLGHLEAAIVALTAEPEATVGAVSIVDPAERRRLDELATGPDLDPASVQRLPDVVARHGTERRDAPAVACGDDRLTYGQLVAAADRLAGELREAGAGPGSVVGLLLERSVETIVAIVGTHRAGAAYLPLDPGYPASRLRFTADDAGADLIVTSPDIDPVAADELGLGAALAEPTDRAPVGDRWVIRPRGESQGRPRPRTPIPDDAAYLIYTSGSTGRPNGVVIDHDNLAASTAARFAAYDRDPSAYLLLSSFSFDSSVAGIFWTLAAGGELVLPAPGTELDVSALAAAIERHRVTHTLCLPSLYRLILDYAPPPSLASLTTVIVAGEACPRSLVERHDEVLNGSGREVALYNEYGPTEATVWATVHRCDRRSGPVPIGDPIPGATVAVLDADGEPAGIGVPGGIHVAGPTLAIGYHDRAELTAARFVERGGRRWFRTGDVGTITASGDLLFGGRSDDQVKVRGIRVELGEVEAAVAAEPGIGGAAVVAVEDPSAGTRLVAYVEPTPGDRDPTALDPADVQAAVRRRLPDAFVPQLAVLDALPRLPNGKVDRANLPADAPPPPVRPTRAPTTDLQRRLVAIWQDLLPGVAIGIDDDFFDVGGHSLLAVSLVERIRRETGTALPLAAILEAPTVASLADRLTGTRTGDVHLEAADGCLVPLRTAGTRLPLYLVPPAAGTALSFRELTAGTDPDQPLYCFEPLGSDGRTEPHDTVEAMAERYVAELVAHRPDGRYRIGGSCLGAIVAWEMARQLEEAGTPAELLVFLDPGPPHSGPDWTYELPSRRSPLQLARDMANLVTDGELPGAILAVWRRNRFDRIGRVHYRAQLSYVADRLAPPELVWLQSEELAGEDWVLTRWQTLAGADTTPVVVPDTTHTGLMTSQPDQVARLVEVLNRELAAFERAHPSSPR